MCHALLTLYNYTRKLVFYGTLYHVAEHPHSSHHVERRLRQNEYHSATKKNKV